MSSVPRFLIVSLQCAFVLMVLVGLSLIAMSSAQSSGLADDTGTQVTTEISVQALTMDLRTALPGVVVFVFGAIGLLLMLVKIPVGDLLKSRAQEGVPFNMSHTSGKETLRRIPLPVWVLLYVWTALCRGRDD